MYSLYTVTFTVSVTSGLSFEVMVIVASPSPTAIMLPSLSIFTTSGLSDSYVSSGYVASSGVTLAPIFCSSPTLTVMSFLGTVISVTGVLTVTVTLSLTVLLSFEVTVIIAVPSPTAMMLPSSSTVTTSGLLDSYVTSLFVASTGLTSVTVILSVSPLLMSIVVLSTVISVTGILTVTFTVSVFVGSSTEVIVIVVVPTPSGVR